MARNQRLFAAPESFIGTQLPDPSGDRAQRDDAKKEYERIIAETASGSGGRDLAASWQDIRHRWEPAALKTKAIGPASLARRFVLPHREAFKIQSADHRARRIANFFVLAASNAEWSKMVWADCAPDD